MNYKQILWPRVVRAVLWTILLHAFPLAIYIAVMNMDLFHPVNWLHCVITSVINIRNWIYLLPLYALLFSLGFAFKVDYFESPPMSFSRFHQISSLFTRRIFIKGLNYLLLSAFLPFLYLRLNDNALTTKCSDVDSVCLHEKNIFVWSSGVWSGVYFFLTETFTSKSELFPPVQQLKFLQIRHQITCLIKESILSAVYPFFYFIPFYFLYGTVICDVFRFLLNAKFEDSITGISGLFNLPLFVHGWLMSTALLLTIKTLKLLYHIHMTEHYSFALVESDMLLSNALGQQVPIIQKLAFYDLYVVASRNRSARRCIFTLSQPGGHPHLWNGIIEECFKLIGTFVGEVEAIVKVPEPKKEAEFAPRQKHVHDFEMTQREQEMLSGPVPLSPTCKLRSLVDMTFKPVVVPPPKSAFDRIMDKLDPILPEFRIDTILEKITPFPAQLHIQSAIHYFFGVLPDAKIKHILSNSECIIWAVLSLAELSAYAITEDQFGIVLQDLPAIIGSLLDLRVSLEKISKFSSVQKKFKKKEEHVSMRDALKSAVRRSLYRIAVAYADHIQDLPLSPETQNIMKNFLVFREC